jgi:hypothetical protein
MHVLDQIVGKLLYACLKRAPRIAGAVRQMKSACHVLEFFQMLCLDVMFVAHLFNRSRYELTIAAFHEREEHELLAMHVAV